MIPAGSTLDNLRRIGEVSVHLTVDTSQFVEQITRAARQMIRLDFELEVRGLSDHQVDARMYVRGTSWEYADPDARDHYLRAIISHPRVGHIAAAAFLAGWCQFRYAGAVDVLAWHRLIGDQPVEVSLLGGAA